MFDRLFRTTQFRVIGRPFRCFIAKIIHNVNTDELLLRNINVMIKHIDHIMNREVKQTSFPTTTVDTPTIFQHWHTRTRTTQLQHSQSCTPRPPETTPHRTADEVATPTQTQAPTQTQQLTKKCPQTDITSVFTRAFNVQHCST